MPRPTLPKGTGSRNRRGGAEHQEPRRTGQTTVAAGRSKTATTGTSSAVRGADSTPLVLDRLYEILQRIEHDPFGRSRT